MNYQNEEDEYERLFAFQRLLDGSKNASEPIVDLRKLKVLCERGIPNHPPHLRPLAYFLLLETLPSEKRLWKSTLKSQRERYYNLVKSFMEELESQPSSSSSPHDKLILQISKDLKSFKSSFWRSRTNPTKSSPFKALSESQLPHQDGDDETLSSDDEYGVSQSDNKVEPMLSRRALFKRIDLLNEIEHKGGFSKSNSNSVSKKGKEKATNQETDGTEQEEQEEIMSPKITLSMDPSPAPMLSRLSSVKPTPLNTSSLQPNPINTQIQVDQGDSTKPNSPITLLSPKPIPSTTSSGNNPNAPYSGSLYHSETHIESLTRLIYIFLRSNPQLEYQNSFIDTISTFYLIHSGSSGNGKSGSSGGLLDYIEENTFWFLSSFFNEIDQIYLNPEELMVKLQNRLNWLNPPLYDILVIQRQLDPKLFAYRWFTELFLKDLPKSQMIPLFDFILSENLLNQNKQPKVDLIVDIGLSMILSIKDLLLEKKSSATRKQVGLWETSLEDEEEDINSLFLRNLQVLREYPIRQIGGIRNIIEMTIQIRKARLSAEANGEIIDSIPAPQPAATAAQPETGAQSSTIQVKDNNSPGILKASSSWSKALGSLWGSSSSTEKSKVDQAKIKDASEYEMTNDKSVKGDDQPRTNNGISNNIHNPLRDRSDTLESTTSSIQERLSALTASTPPSKNLIGIQQSSTLQQSPLPRSLILSSSANNTINTGRRSSAASSTNSSRLIFTRRDSNSSITSSNSLSSPNSRRISPPLGSRSRSGSNSYSPENAILSPPPSSLKSPPPSGGGGGLYRIGSRQRSRSSLGDQFTSPKTTPDIKRDLNYGEYPQDLDQDHVQTPNSGINGRSRSDSNSNTPRPISLSLSEYEHTKKVDVENGNDG